jgi:hypothetical protein
MHDASPKGHEMVMTCCYCCLSVFLSVVYGKDAKPASHAMIISRRVFSLPTKRSDGRTRQMLPTTMMLFWPMMLAIFAVIVHIVIDLARF